MIRNFDLSVLKLKNSLYILGISLFVNLLFKIWKWDEPIETDMFTYCMGGHAFITSKLLYYQLWDQKPPLAHFIYGCVELLFGYGKTQIRAVNIIFSSILITECWVLVMVFLKRYRDRALAMALLVVGILPNINYEVNQPNTELLINSLLAAAFLIACLGKKNGLNVVLFGITCALSTLIKHHAVLPCGLLALFHGFLFKEKNPIKKFSFLLGCIAFTVCFWGLMFLYYQMIGHFVDIWQNLVISNVTYNQDFSLTLWQIVQPHNVIFLLLALTGSWNALYYKSGSDQERLGFLSIGLALGCYLMLAAPGKWWPHYYQLMIVPMFCSAVLVLGSDFERSENVITRILRCFLVLIVCALSLYNLWTYVTLNPYEISSKKYKGPWYLETELMAPKINALLQKDEWFFQWGQDIGLYVYTNRWPHTRLNSYFPFIVGKVQDFVYPVFFHDVAVSPPDMVVFPHPQIGMIAPNIKDPILDWISTNYFPIPNDKDSPPYLLCARIGSNLDKRLPEAYSRKPLKVYVAESANPAN